MAFRDNQSAEQPVPVQTLRRKRRDGTATRERIIAAAIQLVSTEGLSAVSSVRLAEAAGIVQSGFYAHFPNVEACVLIAAEQIGQSLRQPMIAGMADLRQHDVSDQQILAQLIERVIALLAEQWQFVDLLLRYRRDPSPLGGVMRQWSAHVRDDIVEHLFVLPQPLTIHADERALLVPAAHMIVAQLLAGLESLVEGWAHDSQMLAQQLASQIMTTANAAYEAIAAQRLET